MGITESKLAELKGAFPHVDVETELKKMTLWLQSPNGSKRKGGMNFILNWLNRSKAQVKPITEDTEDPSLRPLIDEYLEDLWEPCKHIIDLNKKAKR